MAYARLIISHFLLITFEDVTKEFMVDTLDLGAQIVTFSFHINQGARLTENDVTPIIFDLDRKVNVTFEIPSEITHNGFSVVTNHSKLMVASGSPNLAITDGSNDISANFELEPRKKREISFSFKPYRLLTDTIGGFNFNLFIHYAICHGLINFFAPGHIVRQGYRVIELVYTNTGLCNICYGKHKDETGRPLCRRGTDCPYIGCCKLCWEFIPLGMYLREHLFDHCTVFKELLAIDPSILPPKVEIKTTLPVMATNPENTTSIVGKRSLSTVTTTKDERFSVEDHKRLRKEAFLARTKEKRNTHRATHRPSPFPPPPPPPSAGAPQP